MKTSTFSLVALGTCAVMVMGASAALAQSPQPTAASHPFGPSQPIAGRYIVVFKDNVANPAAETANLMRGLGGTLHHTYARAIKGFAASLPEAALQGIRNNPNVDYIEQDQSVSLNEVASPRTQNNATWGLDRIDQASRPLDLLYHANYVGTGVNAFIIDTGIRADHVEFTGRMLPGYNVIADTNGTNDCNGHGTHVAGTVGGATWGVAKGVSLTPVRVLDCGGSGTWSGVIAGIDWVANSTLRPAVANMSLGGGASASVDAAVEGAVSRGVTMVVAAGNSNADACNSSPARAPGAITVGATTSSDARASYSNYGSCLDLFAPGSSITSAWNSSATATNILNGTSMASPHVAGVAALALAANPAASPAAVASFLTTYATANVLTLVGTGSPNKLVYSLAAGAPQEPVRQSVSVSSLVGSATKSGANWRASTVVTLRDIQSNALVRNATVAGSFSPGGSASCVTDTTGSCKLSSATINRNTSLTKLTVNSVTGSLMDYVPNYYGLTTITISKP